MSRFPAWISKTQFRKASPQQRTNMLQATTAIMEYGRGSLSASASMAFARGLPENPKWIKGEIPSHAHDDLVFLAARVRRALRREASEQRQRAARDALRQRSCAHTWERIPGTDSRYCNLCKLTEFG